MGFLKKMFGEKEPEKSLLEVTQEVAGKLIVDGYRNIGKNQDIAPSDKTSDEEIIEIYAKVGSAYRKAASERNEEIPAGIINLIVLQFLQVKETMGEAFLDDHLVYEIEKYLEEGLRADYQQELNLF